MPERHTLTPVGLLLSWWSPAENPGLRLRGTKVTEWIWSPSSRPEPSGRPEAKSDALKIDPNLGSGPVAPRVSREATQQCWETDKVADPPPGLQGNSCRAFCPSPTITIHQQQQQQQHRFKHVFIAVLTRGSNCG
ncbi:hypothetical protein EYF80_027638 [Liparis tanakae]|uniref:Uncharacterized protein n=1 Tax=Liparis tanakae TaxID=230148 RepID=A0A4Z2H8D4_9TELE|nr:hypothetical protein EYF80_027638 [Liparis tanakae]